MCVTFPQEPLESVFKGEAMELRHGDRLLMLLEANDGMFYEYIYIYIVIMCVTC